MQPATAAAATAVVIGGGEDLDGGDDGDNRRFAAAVAAVTSAFGDPTRREIFLYVRSRPGATTAEAATRFSLHPNVARHHLDRLVAAGYLQVAPTQSGAAQSGAAQSGAAQAGGGQPGAGPAGVMPERGAGRPAKRYLPVGDDPTIELLTRRDDLLVNLLQEALALLGPEAAERMAAKVGEDYGRDLASRMAPGEGQRSVRAAMHAIAETLTAHGFAAHAEDQGSATAVVAEQCPFGEAAQAHPVLCAVDRGMVKGLLAGLCKDVPEASMPVVLSSRARGDDTCAALA